MLFNLNRYSQNPAQCHIIDSSTGSINYTNLQANSKRVVEALQAKYPDKFVEVNAVKEEISVKDGVDFSKPEETNKYFDNLYKGLSECKNREEKINYIENNFDLSLENMSEREKDEVISKFETRQKIREIKSTLDKDKISKENLDLTSEQIDELLEDKAAEQFAIENKKDIETTKQINNTMIEFENTKQEIEKFKQGLLTCNNQDERKDILDEIAKLEELSESIKTNLGLTDNEIIKINQNIEDTHDELDKDENLLNLLNIDEIKLEKDTDLSTSFNTDTNELEEDLDLSDLFNADTNEVEENLDLSDLFNADVNEVEEGLELSGTEQTVNYNKITEDLKQEDYTMEVDDKKSLWDRIKNRFSAIKNTILEKLNLNRKNTLKGQEYLDTAENNTRSSNEYAEIKNTFDQSLIVSEEDQEKYRKEYEASKNTSQKSSSNIKIHSDQSIGK